MQPIDTYKNGRSRAEHLLKLAELLLNTRRRNMRADWARNFKTLMQWRQSEKIDRVDGRGAVLILRQASNVTARHFTDEYLCELLRAALVGIVSALDRYCHEAVLMRLVAELQKSQKNVTRELRSLHLPAIAATKAVKHAKKTHSRPMNLIKQALQDELYRETYQRPDDIASAMKTIGVKGLWENCAKILACTAKDIVSRLNGIVERRNKIVHEGDIRRHRRGGKLTYNIISAREVADDIIWISKLVDAIDSQL